jgi:hypothetical protein
MRHPEPVWASVPLWRSSEAGKSVGNAGVANGVVATGFRACFISIDRPSVRAWIRVGAARGHPSVGRLDGVGVPVEPFGVGARIVGVDQNDFAPARGDGESPHCPKRVEFGTRQSRWRRLGGRPCAERLGKTGDAERARPCVRTNVTGTSGASYKARFLRRHSPSVSAVRAGDRDWLPAGTVHSARIGEEAVTHSIGWMHVAADREYTASPPWPRSV